MLKPEKIYSKEGRTIFSHHGNIKDLGLDALVLPMRPDFTLMLGAPLIQKILIESEEDIFSPTSNCKGRFLKENLTKGERELYTIAPTGSAHITDGYKKNLAEKMIYSVTADIAEAGNLFFNMDILKKTIDSTLNLADEHGIRTIGIPSLMGCGFKDYINEKGENTLPEEHVLIRTAILVKDRIDKPGNSPLSEIYLLSKTKDIDYKRAIFFSQIGA